MERRRLIPLGALVLVFACGGEPDYSGPPAVTNQTSIDSGDDDTGGDESGGESSDDGSGSSPTTDPTTDPTTAGTSGVTAGDETTTGEPVDPPPFEPVYRIDVRVHRADSGLSDAELTAIFDEMNSIWRSQAAVCFEFEVVNDEQLRPDGFDIWWHVSVSGSNGYYAGDHDIHTQDVPSLGSAPNPVMQPSARTAAHELGHGLTLQHDQSSDDLLMRSGTLGWNLPMYQIEAARNRAAQMALADQTPVDCGDPVFN